MCHSLSKIDGVTHRMYVCMTGVYDRFFGGSVRVIQKFVFSGNTSVVFLDLFFSPAEVVFSPAEVCAFCFFRQRSPADPYHIQGCKGPAGDLGLTSLRRPFKLPQAWGRCRRMTVACRSSKLMVGAGFTYSSLSRRLLETFYSRLHLRIVQTDHCMRSHTRAVQ